MDNLNIIHVKYLQPTNSNGSKTLLKTQNDTVKLDYDYKYNSSIDQAIEYLKNKDHQIIGYDLDHIVMETFHSIK